MSCWIYQWPTPLAFFVFTLIITACCVIGLYLFRQTSLSEYKCGQHNAIIGIFAATVSVFLGVVLSFVILAVWNNYTAAELAAQKESQAIYFLYGTVKLLPNSEATQQLIISYMEEIINEEYPALKDGTFPENEINFPDLLRVAIYGFVPKTDQEVILYAETIDWLNEALALRIDRYNAAFRGVYPVIWWVAIIDSILITVISWYIDCKIITHYILMAAIGIYISASLFLVLVLSRPFEGYLGLDSLPFQIGLAQIMAIT